MMAIDSVCGMTVDEKSTALRTEYQGSQYYFCSDNCRHKFLAAPQKYVHSVVQESAVNGKVYTCPMHPEVRSDRPGNCPKCGMALEPLQPSPAVASKTEYVCPMHPQIVRSEPGNCPICGMVLEPRTLSAQEEANPELVDMTRRFWVSSALAAPVFLMSTVADLAPAFMDRLVSHTDLQCIEFVMATPVVVWGGWPLFQRGWASLVNRSLNMFTLIALGVGVAWLYSVVALFAPALFPPVLRMADGTVPV